MAVTLSLGNDSDEDAESGASEKGGGRAAERSAHARRVGESIAACTTDSDLST